MTKKICPISMSKEIRAECIEKGCAWWGEYEGACSVFNISTALRIMTRSYGDNE